VTTTVSAGSEQALLERGHLRVEISLRPFALTVRGKGRRLVRAGGVWVAEGMVHDHLVQFAEGVVAHEELTTLERAARARVAGCGADWLTLSLTLEEGRLATLRVSLLSCERVSLELRADADPLRLALDWDRRSEERFVGLGARHGTQFDQAGRDVQLGADRRYTGPDCPPDMLAQGGIRSPRATARRCRG
jgi:hypothetical protein